MALLSSFEREVSPDDRTARHKILENYIGAKMHVVVAIQALGPNAIKPFILLLLRLNHIFKRSSKSWMKEDRCKPAGTQEARDLLLLLHEARRALAGRVSKGEIQMETRIHAMLKRKTGSSL